MTVSPSLLGSVVRLDRARDVNPRQLGVRARGLLSLPRLGLPLPHAYVVCTEVLSTAISELLPKGHEPSALLSHWDRQKSVERAARARSRLLEEGVAWANRALAALPPDFEAAPGLAFIASPELSHPSHAEAAGLLKTWFWGANTAEPLAKSRELALLNVWALSCDDTALRMLARKGVRGLEMAVLVVHLGHIAPECTTSLSGRLFIDEASQGRSENGTPHFPVRGSLQALSEPGLREPTELHRISASGKLLAAETCDWFQPAEGGLELEVQLAWFGQSPVAGPIVACEARPPKAKSKLKFGTRRTQASPVFLHGLGDMAGNPTPFTLSLLRGIGASDLAKLGHGREWEFPRAGVLFDVRKGDVVAHWKLLESGLGGEFTDATLGILGLPPGTNAERGLRGSGPSALAVQAGRFQRRLTWLKAAVADLKVEADPYFAAFRELDLGILPTDATTTTLRETRFYFLQALRLWILSELTVLLGSGTLHVWLSSHLPAKSVPMALSAASLPPDLLPYTRAALDRNLLSSSDWIERWGYLPMQSLELGEARWEEAQGALRSDSNLDPSPPSVRRASPDPVDGSAALLEAQRLLGDRVLGEVERSLSRPNRWLFARSLHSLREAVVQQGVLRDELARASWMLRRTLLDVDRRLRRLDSRLAPGSAFFCTFRELLAAVAESHTDLGQIVEMRKARAIADNRERPRSSEVGLSGGTWVGVGMGVLKVRGRPVLVTRETFDSLPADTIGVVTGFAPWLNLALPKCAGWVVLSARAFSSSWFTAGQLGVPLISLPDGSAEALLKFSQVELDPQQGLVRGW